MDAPDALAELLAHLERDGTVPLSWAVAHAPDGDLRPAWEGSCSAEDVLAVAQRVVDRPTLVAAACACAAVAVALVAHGEPRPGCAIALALQWARGEATLAEVRRAAEAAHAAGDETVNPAAAAYAAAAAAGVAAGGDASDVAKETAFALAFVAASDTIPFAEAYRRALATLAPIVRAWLPCPRVEQFAGPAAAGPR